MGLIPPVVQTAPRPLSIVTSTVAGTMLVAFVRDDDNALVVDDDGYTVFTYDDDDTDELDAPVGAAPIRYLSEPRSALMVTLQNEDD